MKLACVLALAAALGAAPALADKKVDPDHAKKDISMHRKMVAAHEAAAKCLETTKSEQACLAALQQECKGVAVGKHCGLKDSKYFAEDKHIDAHRTVAAAHRAAADCLAAGTAEKTCHEKLAKDCQGLAIGKYCGMRHLH